MKHFYQIFDKIATIALKYTLYIVLLTILYCWFNPKTVRQWNLRYNNIEPTECDMIQKKIEFEKAEKRRLEAIRINKNFGITQ